MRAKQSPGRDLNLEPTNDNDNTNENETPSGIWKLDKKTTTEMAQNPRIKERGVGIAVLAAAPPQIHGRVVVGGWVSSPAGQNRRTVGHCGRTKLLLHAHCFDTLGDPIELNANAKKRGRKGGHSSWAEERLLTDR